MLQTRLFVLAVVCLSCIVSNAAADDTLAKAQAAYQQLNYPLTITLLETALSESAMPTSAENTQRRASYRHWLGRAYGRQAQCGSWLQAMGLAKKALKQFEQAVTLDKSNIEALYDLFSFYVKAPKIVGGGRKKAKRLLPQLAALDPKRGQQAEALLAMSKKHIKRERAAQRHAHCPKTE